tara:strand:- start:25 stop:285 length:261 start_codon:yes stop_codon:yes gene_type:complete
MPEEGRFRRDVVNGSELNYIKKMIYFYSSTLEDLSKHIGEETEFKVTITKNLLAKIEERLSEFEEKERKIIANYKRCIEQTEGVMV